ncbi:MAG: hypothetical protein KUG78_08490 [Kangiellaceae bacterium]|nr:hypothetical protein [Kangiellaceae bacterium]
MKILVLVMALTFFQNASAAESMSFVQYDKKHAEVVETGIESIISYYGENSLKEKRSLLLCLDRYLDPYYKYDLSYAGKIYKWLDNELTKAPTIEIKEDIFQLLQYKSDSEYEDCEILEDGEITCAKS